MQDKVKVIAVQYFMRGLYMCVTRLTTRFSSIKDYTLESVQHEDLSQFPRFPHLYLLVCKEKSTSIAV